MGHTLRTCGLSEGLEGWRKYKKKNCHLAKCFDITPIWLCAAAPVDGADRDVACGLHEIPWPGGTLTEHTI